MGDADGRVRESEILYVRSDFHGVRLIDFATKHRGKGWGHWEDVVWALRHLGRMWLTPQFHMVIETLRE